MNLFLANSVFYYKELTDGAMNDKFQDLQSASWRPRRADGITSSSSLSPVLGEKQCPSSKAERKSKFFLTLSLVFIQAFGGLDAATHERGKSALLSTLTQMIVSSRNIRTDTP